MARALCLLLVAAIVGCDSSPVVESIPLVGVWETTQRVPTFTPIGYDYVAYDVRFTLRDDGTYHVERAESYFFKAEPTDTVASSFVEYGNRFTTTGDSLLLGPRAPALRYRVYRDSLVLRLALPDSVVVEVPGECGLGNAPPPECGGTFERVR
jgi:hypothetical protein